MLTDKRHTTQLTFPPQPFHSNDDAMHFTRSIPSPTAVQLDSFPTCLGSHIYPPRIPKRINLVSHCPLHRRHHAIIHNIYSTHKVYSTTHSNASWTPPYRIRQLIRGTTESRIAHSMTSHAALNHIFYSGTNSVRYPISSRTIQTGAIRFHTFPPSHRLDRPTHCTK